MVPTDAKRHPRFSVSLLSMFLGGKFPLHLYDIL
jgi:hypothetical protein